MSVPDRIKGLTETFNNNLESYKKGIYNETQVRREYIDPFFEELGWDIANKQGYAEAYKDVIHEDAIKVGGVTKAPDYCFRIGGVRKFFLEAKKPSVNIKEDIHPAYQLRRYGWSAKLPLCILTDFEELAVYDCRVKPAKTDKASNSRILYLKYTDYADRWGEIAGVFSRDAILKGSFDKYVESNKGKKGTTEVDTAFLHEIENWRELLARNIALRNLNLSQRELNFAVQQTIDRIVFLRICEDRGMETYGGLMALRNGENVYKRLFQLFNKADDKYNSGLFHFKKEKGRENCDNLTPSLQIDDKPLKEIFKNLYYPESPYEFSVLSADILGQVYERFLGKVIRLTAGHQAKIEEKPEVRKAGGVYYTPDYIVDYIVKNTVGKLVEGKRPGPKGGVRNLKILDPACGSGSFLIGAYHFLLDWHRDEYIKDGPVNWSKGKVPRVYQSQKGEWRLTTDERKRILLNNIYGVDIDHQAVEVTKLSLLLKVLEGEDEQSIGKQMLMFQERVLPDLSNNIKCGNSLIGPDFYENQQMNFLDEEEMYRINTFDWNAEFADIMKDGGFDAVIGNPPWISLSGKFGNDIHTPSETAYLVKLFQANTYMPNMYEYFVTQGFNLTKPDGFFGFIVPDRLGFNDQFVALRRRILKEARILLLLYKSPFPGITADTLVFVLQKGEPSSKHCIAISEYGKHEIQRVQAELVDIPGYKFEYFEDIESMQIIRKMDLLPAVKPIAELCKSTSGFGGKSKLIQKEKTSSEQIPTFKGDSIGRYEIRQGYWFDFRKENITGRTTDTTKLGASPKVLLRKTGDSIIATFDESGTFPEQSLYFLYDNQSALDLKFILGVLNSKLFTYYYRARSLTNKMSIAQVKKKDLDQLPIYYITFSCKSDRDVYQKIIECVDLMLALNIQKKGTILPQANEMLKRQIDVTDRQINDLVYKLYNFTDEEIKKVESVA